jgi:transposase
MTMLAETVDAVIGTGNHRDSHEVEIADLAGKPIAVMRIGNDSAGFTQLLTAIADVVPGPRVAVCIEGSRSYGIGLARALAAAGLLVLECEQPSRRQRRGKGKSDPIDAHLAVLAALRLDAGRLPVPRADGDREALRILLVARQEITVACTAVDRTPLDAAQLSLAGLLILGQLVIVVPGALVLMAEYTTGMIRT